MLLRLNASQALLYAVSTFQPSDSVPLKAALTRALRALAAAIADTVGPSQWGISPAVSDLRPEAKAALDNFFQVSSHHEPESHNSLTLYSPKFWTCTFPSSTIRHHKSVQLLPSSLHHLSEILHTAPRSRTGVPRERG